MGKQVILLLTLCILLSAYSCSSSKSKSATTDVSEPYQVTTRPLEITVPQWVLTLPTNVKCCVGISTISQEPEEMVIAAKEMATVQYARNLLSYNVDSFAQMERYYGDSEYHDSRRYDVQVSKTDEIRRLYDRLQLKDYFFLHKVYFVGLFEYSSTGRIKDVAVNMERKMSGRLMSNRGTPPEWFTDETVYPKGDYLYSVSFARASSLIGAWEEANKKGRVLLSKYHTTSVEHVSAVDANDLIENVKDVTAIQTSHKLQNIELLRSHIQGECRDNNIVYTVYVELRVKS